MNEKLLGHYIEVWKKTVDVQQHFNEIEMKIRNFAIIVFAGIFGAFGMVFRFLQNKNVGDHNATLLSSGVNLIALFLLAFGFIAALLFWFVDKHWYHRLLIGAVKEGINLEKKICDIYAGGRFNTKHWERKPCSIF